MKTQSSALYTIPENSSTSENYNPPSVSQSIIYNLSLSSETFIHIFNNLLISSTHNKIMKHKIIMNYTIITNTATRAAAKPIGKAFLGILNVHVTINDICELFGLRTTKYLLSNIYVEMLLNNKMFCFCHCGVGNFLQNYQISLFP